MRYTVEREQCLYTNISATHVKIGLKYSNGQMMIRNSIIVLNAELPIQVNVYLLLQPLVQKRMSPPITLHERFLTVTVCPDETESRKEDKYTERN